MSHVKIAIVFTLLAALPGCTKPDPNPEEHDPIYQDLQTRLGVHSKAADEAKAKITELMDSIPKKRDPLDVKDANRELEKARATFLNADQWARYYKIRVARRKVEDKFSYGQAFAAHQAWPPREEWAEYETNRRLVESPRDWNLRVPKLQSRLPSSTSGKKAEAKGEGEKKGEE